MVKAKKIKYVQLEPSCYPSDTEWLMMSAENRGIYHSLIIYLYCKDGRLDFDPKNLCKLCNVTENVFELFWNQYGTKFLCKNGAIFHKRVTKQIKHARKLIKQRSLAGKASANARSSSVATPVDFSLNENEDETKTKINKKNNTNNEIQSSGTIDQEKIQEARKRISSKISSSRPSLRFAEQLEKILPPKNKSDRKAYLNLIHWLVKRIDDGQLSDNAYNVVLDFARKAKTGQNPIAVFFDTLKKEIGYRKCAED